MNRMGLLMLGAALAVPAVAHAQSKPSSSMHTRSAEVYLRDARASPADKEELLQKAVEVLSEGDKENPRVWLLLGQAYALQEDAVGADSAFDRAESLYPEYEAEIEPLRENLWASLYNAAVASLQANALDEALSRFEQADAIYRGRPEALMAMAPLYVRRNDYAKAEAAYRAVLEVVRAAPEDLEPELRTEWESFEEVAIGEIGTLLGAQQKYDEAAAFYRELLAADPQNTAAKTELAVALSRAGQADEAATLYAELLAEPSLDEAALFNIGVGLYRAEQFESAAQAFRRALERNPHANETRYNLGQAVYASAAAAEQGAKDPAVLRPLYEELSEVAKALTAADPNNRNAWIMLAQAQRSLVDMTEGPTGQELRNDMVRALEAAEALTFEVTDVSMRPTETGVQLTGGVVNLKLEPGTPVRLRFTLVDTSGASIASQEAQVTAPAVDEAVEFTIEIPTEANIAGWKYERVE